MTTLNDVTVKQGRRMIVATVEDERFEFPEMWSVGYCQSHPGTDARDAAVAWHEQTKLGREFARQQRRSA